MKAAICAARRGVLPVTSRCDMRCLFCSNPQNPPGVLVATSGPISPAGARMLLGVMRQPRKIVIGESATRLVEGEPFTNPHLLEIMRLARSAFPQVPMQLTTNGSGLCAGTVRALRALRPLEVVVSLNSSSPEGRRALMGDVNPRRAIDGIDLLAREGMSFQGSVVVVPAVVGWDDIARTVRFLEAGGASLVRLMLPGVTRFASRRQREILRWAEETDQFVAWMRREVKAPIVLEPPRLSDLRAVVEGVIPGSAADAAGVRPGDEITAVGGKPVRSRVDAFTAAREAEDVELAVRREGKSLHARLRKKEGEAPGFVMSKDIDMRRAGRAAAFVRAHGADRCLVLTSRLAVEVVRKAMCALGPEVRVEGAPNLFFGGSIAAAGLLTVGDVERCLARRPGKIPPFVLVPAEMFDGRGKDLLGRGKEQMERRFGVRVVPA